MRVTDLGSDNPLHGLGPYSLGAYSLGVYSLQPPILELVTHIPLWESTVWESRVWESTGLAPPDLDPAMQTLVLKKNYIGPFNVNVV